MLLERAYPGVPVTLTPTLILTFGLLVLRSIGLYLRSMHFRYWPLVYREVPAHSHLAAFVTLCNCAENITVSVVIPTMTALSLMQAYRTLHRLLLAYKDEKRGPTFIAVQSSNSKSWHFGRIVFSSVFGGGGGGWLMLRHVGDFFNRVPMALHRSGTGVPI